MRLLNQKSDQFQQDDISPYGNEEQIDIDRKTKSYSPFRESMIFDINKQSEKEQSQFKQEPSEINQNSQKPMIRKKSRDNLTIDILLDFTKFANYIVSEKGLVNLLLQTSFQSDVELLEIKNNIIQPERAIEQTANYFTIILGDLENLIDQFLELSNEKFPSLQKCKEMIIKFDKLRADMLNKIKHQSLPKEKVYHLNVVFGYLRFILTRFGRIINFFDTYQVLYQRKQNMLTTAKQPPAIRKILMQENQKNFESELARRSSQSPSSISSKKNDSVDSNDMKLSLFQQSSSTISNIMKSPNLLDTTEINQARIDQIKEVFVNLSKKEKKLCLQKYMNVLTQNWKKEHEQLIFFYKFILSEERKLTVPQEVCRICQTKFYCDREQQHSKYCWEKVKRQKERQQFNHKFLEISNKLTECMLFVEKTNQFNTPRLPHQPFKQSLLNTPTLKRRSPLVPDFYKQESFVSASESDPSLKISEEEVGKETHKKKSSFYNADKANGRKAEQEEEEEKELVIEDDKVETAKQQHFTMKDLPQIPPLQKMQGGSFRQNTGTGAKLAFVIPKLDLNKVGTFQDTQQQQQQPQQQSMNPLLMYSAKKGEILPSSLSQRQNTGLPSAQTKNTLNTLRGLVTNTNKNLKSFDIEKPQVQQQSTLGSTEIIEKPQETPKQVAEEDKKEEPKIQEVIEVKQEVVVVEETKKVVEEEEKKALPSKPPKQVQSIFSIPEKNEKVKEKPKTNILNAFASIRNAEKPSLLQQPPASSRGAYSNALGFFNEQKKEEKKNFDPKTAVKTEKKKTEKEKAVNPLKEKRKQEIKEKDIKDIQVPQSPYLQNVSKKFDKVNSKYLPQFTTSHNNEQKAKKEQKDSKISQAIAQTSITSPYIGLSKNLTKEEKKKHFETLKKHVHSQIGKDLIDHGSNKKDKKSVTVSNAFQVVIKNEKKEVLKNIEDLRKSVKLKKRATPLEKIMTKLVTYDNEDQFTPNFHSLNQPVTESVTATSQTLKVQDSPARIQNSITKVFQVKSMLQAIDEEDDQTQKKHEAVPAEKEEEQKIEIVEKKIEEILPLNKPAKSFQPMSPIISFRPLNKFGGSDNSSSNTPLGTPILRGAVTSRDPNSTNSSSQFNNEEMRSQQLLQNLQNAKKELDILESLKSMAVDVFNLTNQVKNIKSKKHILSSYYDQLKLIQSQCLVSQNSMVIVQQFVDLINHNLKMLEEDMDIEKQYQRTLPCASTLTFTEDDKKITTKYEIKMNISTTIKEAPSQLTSSKAAKKKESGIFFPSLNSPRPESFINSMASNQGSVQLDQSFSQNDNEYVPFQQIQKATLPISATPLIYSRGNNFQHSDNQKIQNMRFPPALLSLSQVNSPQVMERQLPQFMQPIKNSDQNSNLKSIEEENMYKLKVKNFGRGMLMPQTNQRQKSQFSNQHHKSASNMSLNASSLSQKSISSESLENNEFYGKGISAPQIKLGDLNLDVPNKSQSNLSLNSENSNISPESKYSKASNMSTFSKSKNKLRKSDSTDPQKKQFFGKDENFKRYDLFKQIGGETGAGSFRQNVQKPEHSKSRLRQLKKKVAASQQNSRKNSADSYIECQSDIIVGMNFDSKKENEDERKTNSDFHDMFYVNDLFSDDKKFYRMLTQMQINEALGTDQNIEEVKVEEVQDFNLDEEEEEDDDTEEVLTIAKVRFNSTCNLPSQLECCSLEYHERKFEKEGLSINDFILLKTISKGAYGKVILARQKNTNDIFAIKVLDKQKMVEKNVIEFIMNERNIMSQVTNDFIVKGIYAFQSKKFLYFVMEFMKGGDLSSLLEKFGSFDVEVVQYYIAQVLIALDHLHQNGIIHRDLKPDNILIDAEGRIKLTDFGLSEAGVKKIRETAKKVSNIKDIMNSPTIEERELEMSKDIQRILGPDVSQLKAQPQPQQNPPNIVKQRTRQNLLDLTKKSKEEVKVPPPLEKQESTTNTTQKKTSDKKNRILGTAHYMAPEVIQGQDHTPALDFWSLGVIIYEFLTGNYPFKGKNPEEVFSNVLKRQIDYPPIGSEEGMMTSESYDLIEKLLTLDPEKRLGSNGIKEIKDHTFFKGFEWDKIMEMPAPFRPVGRDQDASYFPNAQENDEELEVFYKDNQNTQNKEVKEFDKFNTFNYGALQTINAKVAKMAIMRANRMKQKAPPQKPRSSMINETILIDIKNGLNQVDQLLESSDEDLATPQCRSNKYKRQNEQLKF